MQARLTVAAFRRWSLLTILTTIEPPSILQASYTRISRISGYLSRKCRIIAELGRDGEPSKTMGESSDENDQRVEFIPKDFDFAKGLQHCILLGARQALAEQNIGNNKSFFVNNFQINRKSYGIIECVECHEWWKPFWRECCVSTTNQQNIPQLFSSLPIPNHHT